MLKLYFFVAWLVIVKVDGFSGTSGDGDTEIDEDEEDAPTYLSCEDVLEKNNSLPSGAYYLADKDGGKSPVYCHFESIKGCGDGPWTLQMKLDGHKQTFHYRSSKWSSITPYQSRMAKTGFDRKETKTIAFSQVPLTILCLGMSVDSSDTRWISVDLVRSSLHGVFSSSYINTNLGREKWKSLIVDSSLQPHCNREGFNVYHNGAKARIGIISNQENNCNTPDSRLGFGTGGHHCGQDQHNTVGNEAACDSDNGDKHIKAFGYILSKNEAFNSTVASFRVDEMMWVYVDGEFKGFYNGTQDHKIILSKKFKVLAIHARNNKVNGGGILGSASTADIDTSTDWKCSNTADEGWTSTLYDDSHWPFAREYGGRWNINRRVNWIWTIDRQITRDVYCRISLEGYFGCPHPWIYHHGSCYRKGRSTSSSYDTAEQNCQKYNSHLASVHNKQENMFLRSLMRWALWIGLKYDTKDNLYNWTDGSALHYTNWVPTETGDIGERKCVYMESHSKWGRSLCYSGREYVCKKELHGCQVRNGDCSHGCEDMLGTYRCTCPYPGHVLGTDQHTCEVSGIGVKLSNKILHLLIPTSAESSQTVFDIHLRDPECKAMKNGSVYIIESLLDACGTTNIETDLADVYSNAVIMNSPETKRGVHNTEKEVVIPLYCFLLNNSSDNCIIPYQSHLGSMSYKDSKYGLYTVSMTLHNNHKFDEPYKMGYYPFTVGLRGKTVHFKIQINSHKRRLRVMPKDCYISPSQDPEDARKYSFIEDGCFTDKTVTYYKSPLDTERLSIKVNHFSRESPYVFIHCKVLVCFARDKNSLCVRGCRKYSEITTTGDLGTANVLSVGPIIFGKKSRKTPTGTPTEKESKKSSGQKISAKGPVSPSFIGISYANFIILALLSSIVLIAVTLKFRKIYRKKIRSTPGTYFNLSERVDDKSM